MSMTSSPAMAGQTIYTTPAVLKVYDITVLGLSNSFIWQCPTPRLLAHYDQHISANHLDVGVGTGYFLDHCRFPSPVPRLALMDLNPNALKYAARRLARYQPELYLRNVLEPIVMAAAKFDSVGLNYLLHCVPGSMAAKAVALDYLKALMNPNAVLFGATLLQGGVSSNRCAKRLMAVYNQRGLLWNRHDTLDGLNRALGQRFRDLAVEVVGCVALFSGRV